MENLKLYIVEFEEESKMKSKIYPFGYVIGGNNQWLIIIIIYNKDTFFYK